MSQAKGQAAVEAALVMPVVITLLMAVLSFGLLFGTQIVIANACREGARFASVGKSTDETVSRIKTYLAATQVSPDKAAVEVLGAGGPSGTDVTVRVTYPVDLVIPIPGLPDPLNVKSSATMRLE